MNIRTISFIIAVNTLPALCLISQESGDGLKEADYDNGKKIYTGTCIVCHGKDGKGALPGISDFTKKTGSLAKEDKILLAHILNGYQGKGSLMAMPPKGGNPKLSNEDIKDCLLYIRKKFGSWSVYRKPPGRRTRCISLNKSSGSNM